MKKSSTILVSLIFCLAISASPVMQASACNLSQEELIEKYGYLCEIKQDTSIISDEAVYYAIEKYGDAAYMPNTGDISESSSENGFRYDVINHEFIRITGVDYSEFDSNTSILRIPDQIQDLPVKEIGYRAFCRAGEQLPYLKEVIIPQSVEVIAERAFSRVFCSINDTWNMSQEQKSEYYINIPENVQFIGYRAFFADGFAIANASENHKVIHLPESLEYISAQAFDGEINSRVLGGIEIDMPNSLVFMSNDSFWSALPFNESVHINNIRYTNSDVFSNDIPDEYLPLMRSVCGKGFYNDERNLVTMKDILCESCKNTDSSQIKTRTFSYLNYTSPTTACSFDECGEFDSLMDYWLYGAAQNASDLLPKTSTTSIESDSKNEQIVKSEITGDVNGDTKIDISDAVLLARFCTEDSTAVITDQGIQNADVNSSGNIDLDDVNEILKKIARIN